MLLTCLTMSAQTAAERQALQHISQVAAAQKSLQCDFVQTKHMKMLGDKMVSRGKMNFTQPDQLRWEYTSPNVFILSLKGKTVTIQKQEGKKMVEVKGNKYMKRLAQLIMGCITGKSLSDAKLFKASVQDSGQTYIVTLIPQKKELSQFCPKMVLTFVKKKEMASRVVMYEKSGDYTEIEFTRK